MKNGKAHSNIKWSAESGFKLQNDQILDSNVKSDKILDSIFYIFLVFKFQTIFLGFFLR